jgi:putative endonuclease
MFTSGKTPVKLVYFEKISDKKSALKREIVLKGFSRKNKEHLIKFTCGDRVSLVTEC